jgi:hypothetical protein
MKAIDPSLITSIPGTMELEFHTALRFFGSHQAGIDMAGRDIILVMASLPLLLAGLFSMWPFRGTRQGLGPAGLRSAGPRVPGGQ